MKTLYNIKKSLNEKEYEIEDCCFIKYIIKPIIFVIKPVMRYIIKPIGRVFKKIYEKVVLNCESCTIFICFK